MIESHYYNLDVSKDLPKELVDAIHIGYEPAGMKITKEPKRETESAEYGACRFSLNGLNIVFRVAKTTPTKIGQFVTVWKRLHKGAPIIPLDSEDGVDFLVVSVFDATHQGQFIFNRKTLLERGIFSDRGRGGKLSFRIYPPWTYPVADAAIKTQRWQAPHFFSLTSGTIDSSQIQRLFG